MNDIQSISPKQAAEKASSTLLLDVRTPAEFQDVHINGAVLQPLSDLNPDVVAQLAQQKSGCIVICRSGGRARQAFANLVGHGLSGLAILEGGMTAWEGEGLPVIRGKKTISLERQVRIAAGAMVFVGSLLGYFVHPGFMALAAFVGAGLVFAGVTDTCGLAMVLAKMPWNQRGAQANACCAPAASNGTTCATK